MSIGNSLRRFVSRVQSEILPADGPLQVASFSTGRHLVFIVSDLSAQDTSQFAQAIVAPVSQRLTNG
jgi:hypothetical protein